MIKLSDAALAAATQEWRNWYPGQGEPIVLLQLVACVARALEVDGYIVERPKSEEKGRA